MPFELVSLLEFVKQMIARIQVNFFMFKFISIQTFMNCFSFSSIHSLVTHSFSLNIFIDRCLRNFSNSGNFGELFCPLNFHLSSSFVLLFCFGLSLKFFVCLEFFVIETFLEPNQPTQRVWHDPHFPERSYSFNVTLISSSYCESHDFES